MSTRRKNSCLLSDIQLYSAVKLIFITRKISVCGQEESSAMLEGGQRAEAEKGLQCRRTDVTIPKNLCLNI